MPRRQREPARDRIEEAIRRAGSIGELERLAGIDSTPEAREAFWRPFARLPAKESLVAGVAELKRRIRAAETADAPLRRQGREHA